jgi:hypothetical protein
MVPSSSQTNTTGDLCTRQEKVRTSRTQDLCPSPSPLLASQHFQSQVPAFTIFTPKKISRSILPSFTWFPPVKMMLEEPRSILIPILILQILLILSKNPLLWNFHTWWRMQFMKTPLQFPQSVNKSTQVPATANFDHLKCETSTALLTTRNLHFGRKYLISSFSFVPKRSESCCRASRACCSSVPSSLCRHVATSPCRFLQNPHGTAVFRSVPRNEIFSSPPFSAPLSTLNSQLARPLRPKMLTTAPSLHYIAPNALPGNNHNALAFASTIRERRPASTTLEAFSFPEPITYH